MGRHNKLQDDGGDAAPEAVPSPEPAIPSSDVTLPDAGPAIAAARAAVAASAAAPAVSAPAAPASATGAVAGNEEATDGKEPATGKLLGLAPWKRRVVFVAPLPVLLLTIVVGIVAYSASTGQISLNFAGGSHEPTEPKDNQVSQRGPGAEARASRNASRNHHLYVAFRGRPHQGRLAFLAFFGADTGVGGNQRIDGFEVARARGRHQGSLPAGQCRVGVSAGLQQQFDDSGVSIRACQGERRDAVPVCGFDIRAGSDQEASRLHIVLMHGPVQCGSSVDLRRIHVRVLLDQGANRSLIRCLRGIR